MTQIKRMNADKIFFKFEEMLSPPLAGDKGGGLCKS
jgi:hypothetical protein